MRAGPVRLPFLPTFLLPVLGVAALQEGDQAALDSVRHRTANEAGVHSRHLMRLWDAGAALACGRFDEARRLIKTFPEEADWTGWQQMAEIQNVAVSIERGRHRRLRPALENYISALPPAITARAQLAFVCAELGETNEAARHVELVRQEELDMLIGTAPFALRYLAELAARLDDRDLARDLLPRLSGFSGLMLVAVVGAIVAGAADRAIGQLLLTLGQVDEAVERFARAEAFERSLGVDALATHTAYWHARALLRRDADGDRASALALLDLAQADARRLDMPLLLADIETTIGGR